MNPSAAVPARLARIRIVGGLAAMLLALVAALLVAALLPTSARADTAPPGATIPKTVSTDVLPTAQINGVVWTQIVVGDIVYAGGTFTTARPAGAASGSSTVARNNVVAYRLSTGALIGTFAPNVNGTVRALAASADGATIYLGGTFTTVNGSTRNRIAAVAATNGATTSFNPNANSTVYAIARSGSTLYFGGNFTTVGGTGRTRAAAVTTAGALTAWAPNVGDYHVNAIAVNGTLGRVALGGNFTVLNGDSANHHGSGLVDATTGRTNAPWSLGGTVFAAGPNAAIESLSSDGASVYGTAYDYGAGALGNFEGTFSASWTTGTLQWVEDCHGDTYSNVPFNGAVYTAGHAHACQNIGGFPETNPRNHHRGLAFSTNATGTVKTNTETSYFNWGGKPAPTLLDWYPDFNTGTATGQSQGPWSVAAGGNYVVYAGEFTTVNGVGQQGLARFAVPSIAPNKDGPRVGGSGLTPTLTASGSTVKVSWPATWDRDNQNLTYRVYRGSTVITTFTGLSTFWNRPTMSTTDRSPGTGTISYHLTASDPFGNTVTGSTATVRVGG